MQKLSKGKRKIIKKSCTNTKGAKKPYYFKENISELRGILIEDNDFDYEKNVQSRLYSSYLMLQLWEYLLSIIEDLSEEERITSLEVISKIISRRVFDPINLESNENEEIYLGLFQSSIKKGTLKMKYKELIYSTYSFIITKLKMMKEFDEQPEYLSFAASILAICSFRIPDAIEVINIICENKTNIKKIQVEDSDLKQEKTRVSSDFTFEELKTKDYIIIEIERRDSKVVSKQQYDRLMRYKKFLGDLKKVENEGHVNDLIHSASDWIPDIKTHQDFFFIFLAEYITEIGSILYTDLDIKFKDLPFYKKLIQLFLESQPQNFSENSSWFNVSTIILKQNPLLLKKFINLNFSNTRIFDFQEVINSLDRVEIWCQGLSSFPCNFDYDFFIDVIRKLLFLDHFNILTRTLIFLYNIIDLFHGIERKKFINGFLFKEFFFDLFLHWNSDTRMCFHRLIIYKIQRIWRKQTVNIQNNLKFNQYTFQLQSRERSNSRKFEEEVYSRKLQTFLLSKSSIKETILSQLSDDQRNSEELLDIVLKSKLDTYLHLVKSVNINDEENKKKKKDDDENYLEIPSKLKPYIQSSLKEFDTLNQEYLKWKSSVEKTTGTIQYPVLMVRTSKVNG